MAAWSCRGRGRPGELVDPGLKIGDTSSKLQNERLQPGGSFALGEDDLNKLHCGERKQCRTIIHAATVANQSVERCTPVKFASRLRR